MTVTTDRLQAVKNGERVLHTNPRIGADITSSLGMKTTIELCRQKRRRIYRHVVTIGREYPIYTMGVRGGAKTKVGNSVLVPVRSGTKKKCHKIFNINSNYSFSLSFYLNFIPYFVFGQYFYLYIYYLLNNFNYNWLWLL